MLNHSENPQPNVAMLKAEIRSRCPVLDNFLTICNLSSSQQFDDDMFDELIEKNLELHATQLSREVKKYAPQELLSLMISTAKVQTIFSDMFDPIMSLQTEENLGKLKDNIPILLVLIGYEIGQPENTKYFVDDIHLSLVQNSQISTSEWTRMTIAAVLLEAAFFRKQIEKYGWNQDLSIFSNFIDENLFNENNQNQTPT